MLGWGPAFTRRYVQWWWGLVSQVIIHIGEWDLQMVIPGFKLYCILQFVNNKTALYWDVAECGEYLGKRLF